MILPAIKLDKLIECEACGHKQEIVLQFSSIQIKAADPDQLVFDLVKASEEEKH